MQFQSGSQGISGKKTTNSMTKFDEFWNVINKPVANKTEFEEVIEDSDDAMKEALGE
jgi:hypothetical protein